ncbi:hypothetical protein H0266_16915 [Halobacillus locisalis]|uniref:YbbR domain-containing protein n=1 Tax=Halobacillus locisalis TaxID=220753 RepID=A0A838CXC3_9BACI|nr:CdaR family protein [Halobacillus locisalis]MBA2176571.1 hypothetical protein [Halobacillus locisalis]
MDNWFRSVWFIRIISLILAGLLWVTVNVDDNMDSDSLFFNDSSSDMEVMDNVPLEIRFDSEEYVVSGLPQEVSVTVEGPASAVTPVVRQENFEVFVDLNGYGPGTHEVSLQHSGISNQLAVTIEPKVIEVTIEEKVSENFSVNVDYINESKLSSDLVLGEAEASPAEVQITGSESAVDRVASVKAIIDVGAAAETIENQEAPVKVYDNQGNELNVLVDPNAVEVTVPVVERSKQVPVQLTAIGGAPEGIIVNGLSTETQQVTLYGPEEVLAEIEALSEVEVDITEITEDQTIDVDLPVPQGVTKVDPKTIKVMIDVDQVGEEGEASTEESPEGTSS